MHAAEAPLDRAADFRCGPYFVYHRPHVREFLTECAELFQLAVWSSSGADYLNLVLAQTVPSRVHLAFVCIRSRCVQRYDADRHERYFVKDLKKVKRLGFDLAQVLIVDDTPKKVERNYGNAIYVKPFVGDTSDCELQRLASYLRRLATVEDVRLIEKRGWRMSVATGERS